MAINPPGDIVLGVILAADPSRYRTAADRLRRSAAAAGGEGAVFPTPPKETAPWRTSTQSDAPPALAARPVLTAPHGSSAKAPAAFAQLEAFVLQSFIQAMLPKESQNFFGKGTAGEVWKSMLAEKLGAQIAKSGQLGLAGRLAAGHGEGLPSSVRAATYGGLARPSFALISLLADLKDPETVHKIAALERPASAKRS